MCSLFVCAVCKLFLSLELFVCLFIFHFIFCFDFIKKNFYLFIFPFINLHNSCNMMGELFSLLLLKIKLPLSEWILPDNQQQHQQSKHLLTFITTTTTSTTSTTITIKSFPSSSIYYYIGSCQALYIWSHWFCICVVVSLCWQTCQIYRWLDNQIKLH